VDTKKVKKKRKKEKCVRANVKNHLMAIVFWFSRNSSAIKNVKQKKTVYLLSNSAKNC
jgi:hypothetical protein